MGSYKCSRDILPQAKGIILIESTQIRSFSRWSGGGGWFGRAVAQQRLRISKLRAKDFPTTTQMRQQSRQPEGGPVGPNKGLLSWHVYSKRRAGKQLLVWLKKGQKAARQIKSITDKKERIAYSNSGWWCRWEKWRQWRWWWVRTSRANHKSMWQRFGVLRVQHQKVGYNRWPIAYTAVAGGGLVLTQHLITW